MSRLKNIKKTSMEAALRYLADGNALGGRPALASVEQSIARLREGDLGGSIGALHQAQDRVNDAMCQLMLALGVHQEELRQRAKRKKR